MEQPATGLGQWLKERCEREGLSLRQAADKTNLSHTTIAQIIKGGSASPETVKRLARAFGGDGRQRLALEDKLLILAGYRTAHGGEELSEPMARLMDRISQFSESQLKLMGHFADFVSELEIKND